MISGCGYDNKIEIGQNPLGISIRYTKVNYLKYTAMLLSTSRQ
jgi:hypothetical protein